MYLLEVKKRDTSGLDSHGNPQDTWGAPTPWEVTALAPGGSTEGEVDRDTSRLAWTVYAPLSPQVPHELDRVLVEGEEFEVYGRPDDYTRGPWPHPTAGVVVRLQRVEG